MSAIQNKIDSDQLGSIVNVNATDHGDDSEVGSLKYVCDLLGSESKTITLEKGTYSVGTSFTIPSNVAIRMNNGAILQVATGKTLTINGSFEAGLYQVFDCVGTGKVVCGAGSVAAVYPVWWGAKRDGVTDDLAAISAAAASLTHGGTFRFSPGTYTIRQNNPGIQLLSNTHVILEPGAIISVLSTTPTAVYTVFWMNLVDNIIIEGGELIGGTGTSEYGHGIRVLGSTNIHVKGMKIHGFYGDGIVIAVSGDGLINSSRIYVDELLAYSNQRNGISIVGANDVLVSNSSFYDQSGTAPEDGIDLEPNNRYRNSRITFKNVKSYNNDGHAVEASTVNTGLFLRDSTYVWAASSTAGEYYVTLFGGSDPSLISTNLSAVYAGQVALSSGTPGSLTAGKWGYGDNDALGFNTIYVKLSDASNPNTKAEDHIFANYTSGVTSPRNKDLSFYDCDIEAKPQTATAYTMYGPKSAGKNTFYKTRFKGHITEILADTTFDNCSFFNSTDYTPATAYGVLALYDYPVTFNNCIFDSVGRPFLCASGGVSYSTKKVINNCQFIQHGNTLADNATVATFLNYYTLKNSSFTTTGTAPATGWKLAMTASPGGYIDDTTSWSSAYYYDYFRSETPRTFEWRDTLTWAGTHEAQYFIKNANLMAAKYIIQSITYTVTGATGNVQIHNDSNANYWVATTALADGSGQYAIAHSTISGSYGKIVVLPDTNLTGSISLTIKGIITE